MDRAQKIQTVEELNGAFAEQESVVIAHYAGLSVADMNELRGAARDKGVTIRVAKNRLVKLAIKGTTYEPLADLFTGPTIIAYATDPVNAAKVAVNFANDNEKLVILGGAMGADVLDVAGVKALSKMPGLEELRGTLVGLLQAPAQKLASVTQAPAGQLARVFGAKAAS